MTLVADRIRRASRLSGGGPGVPACCLAVWLMGALVGQEPPPKSGPGGGTPPEQEGARSQDPEPQDPQSQDPQRQDPAREKPPERSPDAAAEILRKLLRGEVQPPTKPEDLPEWVEIPPGPKPPRAGDSPVQGPEGPPVPRRREPPPDPAFDAARRALERVLPGAERVDLPADEVRDAPDVATGPARVTAGDAPEASAGRAADGTPALPEPAYPVHGYVSLEYRGRRARDGFGRDFDGSTGRSDQDLTAISGIDFGDARNDAVTGRFLGRGRFDLDQQQTFNPFNGINETYDGGTELHLWDAWIDLHRVPGFDNVRLGRQTIYTAPRTLFLDGLSASSEEFGEWRLSAGGFVGLPSRFYSGHDAGEFLSGIWGESRPWSGGRAKVEWVHVDDERQGFELTDDVVSFSVWQAVGSTADVHARHTLLDGRARDVLLRFTGSAEEIGLSGRVAYQELLDTQRRLTLEFDPFWESTFDQFPYRQVSASLNQFLGDQFELAGGLDVRRLTDGSNEGQFNRDYERYYATLTWYDDPEDDTLSISLTVDAYDASRGDDVVAFYGDVRWRASEAWDLAFGTDYSLYQYDWQLQSEREDVYAGFARVDHDFSDSLAGRVEYRLEDAAGDLFHSFQARATWTF